MMGKTMKKFVFAAIAALALAGTAAAASTTVEFTNDDGTKVTIKFNDDGTSLVDGKTASKFTADEAAKKICGPAPDGSGDVCATFESWGSEVGHTTKYTLSSGGGGTAKITAVEK
jgi:UrcA family protein